MGYSKEDQETSLVYEAETGEWMGYSCYPPHITKIVKLLGIDNVDAKYEDGRESPLEIKFKLNVKQVSFRSGNTTRVMTEEQRKAATERLAKAREKSKS